MRVVILEQDPIGRRQLEQVLHLAGHAVAAVESVSDILRLLASEHPDLVLVDMFQTSPLRKKNPAGASVVRTGGLPVVLLASQDTCVHLAELLLAESHSDSVGFDHLDQNQKLKTLDRVQHLCEVLARDLRCNSGRATNSCAG